MALKSIEPVEPLAVPCGEQPILCNRTSWMMIRQALLMFLDVIERMLELSPRTAELRKAYKEAKLAARPRG